MSTYCIGDIHGNFKGLQQVLERAPLKEGDTIIFLGDYVDGWSQSFEVINYLLELSKSYNCIFIKGNHDCLDDSTELCTKRGWLNYKDISENDLVLGINKSGKSEWQSINKIIIKTSDHLNYYSNDRLDMAITDNHRIIYKVEDNYDYKQLKDLKYTDRLKIPKSCKFHNEIDYNISDEEIKLTAWILTDGGISKKYGYITIYQSKINNIKHIENLLGKLELTFNHVIRNRIIPQIKGKKLKSNLPQHEFKINSESSKLLLNKLKINKEEIPQWIYHLSFRQLILFIEEIIKGDGSKYSSEDNYILFGTQKFLSNIQPIFNICDYSANITKSNRDDYRLNISKHNTISIRQDVNKIERINGKFNVWCLNVPFSNFLVRRNGMSYFTGNSWCETWLTTNINERIWLVNGGYSTIESYLKDTKQFERVAQKHLTFFNHLKDYYIDNKNNLFIHAGFSSMHGPKGETFSTNYYWDRTLWEMALALDPTIEITSKRYPKRLKHFNEIFIGHTSTTNYGITEPIHAGNLWNLDTGSGFSGKLTIMDIETKEFWQSDNVPTLYPNEKGRN